MKKHLSANCLVLLALCILSACSQEENVGTSGTFRAIDVAEFQKCFFLKCIELGYPGDTCITSILQEDVSRMGDFPLGIDGYRAVDSLAYEVRKEIVADSLMLMTRRDDEIGKKRVFQICLKYYSNGTADSVAAKVLRRYRQ